jgi:hypothetical protein
MDATRATARRYRDRTPPVTGRRCRADINQPAGRSSFEAFGRFLDSANPFEFWAQAVQMAWLPWHAAFQAMLPPGSTLPLLGPLTPRSKAGPGGMK